MTIGERELRERATPFLTALAQAGFDAQIIETSFRDYMVKVAIGQDGQALGRVAIHFKVTRGTFSLTTSELTAGAPLEAILACWVERTSAPEDGNGLQAFVDGSFIDGRVTYGAVVLRAEQIVAELSGVVSGAESVRQIAGEIAAVEAVLRWCAEAGETVIDVYYDYAGLEKWATGAWKANQPLTQAYQQKVRASGVAITWHKVESHTGDRWNEYVDQLAKAASTGSMPLAAGVDPVSPESPAEAAERLAHGFAGFLHAQGIPATFDRIINQMAARIQVAGGVADIYHTAKKPRRIDVYALSASQQDSVKTQWAGYLAMLDGRESDPLPAAPLPVALRDAAHYRALFAPWADFPLDFSDFANALRESARAAGLSFDAEQARFNFALLERVFEQLEEQFHD